MKVLLDLQYLNVATTGIKTYMMELSKAVRKYPHPDIEWIFTHEPEDQAADKTYKSAHTKVQKLNYHLTISDGRSFCSLTWSKSTNPMS
ncbi:hypothetical protein [Algoriphagus boritolerans]|uniref:hypothetical protein n=1 Tax=Algoriphagus boritolerans TaxID=308111 RepID=UPI000AEAF606